MNVETIDELTKFTLTLVPQSNNDIVSFFTDNYDDIFKRVTILENDQDDFELVHRSEQPKFRITYNHKFIEILIGDFEIHEDLLYCINEISSIQNYSDITLTLETVLKFDTYDYRDKFFYTLHPVNPLLSDDSESVFFIKEMIKRDGYRHILSILQDSAQNNNGEVVPVIVCSMDSSLLTDGTFKFREATQQIVSIFTDVLKKLERNAQGE